MKRSFLNHGRPLLTTMVRDDTPNACIATIKNAIFDGTDALGLHISCLKSEYHKAKYFKQIFEALGQRPIYLTYYCYDKSNDKIESEHLEMLLTALEVGGTMIDLVGDTFCPTEGELTYDKTAISKQKSYINRVHDMGKEVLISSHVMKFLKPEKVVEIALEHQERGADVSKIVVSAYSEEEELANMEITYLLQKKLQIPYLLLSCGTHYKLHRMTGGMLGNCMVLCVQCHDPSSAKCKPVLRAMKQIYSCADWLPDIIPDNIIK